MVEGNLNSNSKSIGKTICSICYEDLNPILEDLQSISICGHVFHEFCLQQWFEYCINGKKKNCPVCKQTCSEQNVNRLYFQSVGDPNDTRLTLEPRDYEEDNWELRHEVKRLEGKVLGLTSTLEQQQKDLKEVNAELFTCKEELKMEVALKDEAVNQQAAIQQLLYRKSKELDRSTLECIRLQDRNMALAKELAALKLVCDFNLEEEEVLRLASVGGEANRKETIDVLKKSFVMRNKSYEEREAHSRSKRRKAKEKINKLKARVQELEVALEGKDNENLRASKKKGSAEPKVGRFSYENQNKAPAETEVDLCIVTGSCDDLSRPKRKRKFKSKDKGMEKMAEHIIASSLHKDNHENDYSIRNKDGGTSETSTYVHEVSQNLHQSSDHKKAVPKPETAFVATGGIQVQGSINEDGISGLRSCSKDNTVNAAPVIILDDDDIDLLPLDDITQHYPSSHIRKESSTPVIPAKPGDLCFSGGLLGPDGTNWHLGKWCKKVKDKGSGSLSGGLQGSVLEQDNNESSSRVTSANTKPISFRSQGCSQIDHFFRNVPVDVENLVYNTI